MQARHALFFVLGIHIAAELNQPHYSLRLETCLHGQHERRLSQLIRGFGQKFATFNQVDQLLLISVAFQFCVEVMNGFFVAVERIDPRAVVKLLRLRDAWC